MAATTTHHDYHYSAPILLLLIVANSSPVAVITHLSVLSNLSLFHPAGRIYLHIAVVNTSQTVLLGNSWALQINKNSFGLAPHSPNLALPDVPPGQQAETSILLNPNANLSHTAPTPPLTLQVSCRPID